MSADSWSKCPKCGNKEEDKLQEARDRYGKIPLEEYERGLLDAKSNPTINCDTLRGDHEFYLEDNILSIDYSCHCTECDFKFRFEKEIDITKAPG